MWQSWSMSPCACPGKSVCLSSCGWTDSTPSFMNCIVKHSLSSCLWWIPAVSFCLVLLYCFYWYYSLASVFAVNLKWLYLIKIKKEKAIEKTWDGEEMEIKVKGCRQTLEANGALHHFVSPALRHLYSWKRKTCLDNNTVHTCWRWNAFCSSSRKAHSLDMNTVIVILTLGVNQGTALALNRFHFRISVLSKNVPRRPTNVALGQ